MSWTWLLHGYMIEWIYQITALLQVATGSEHTMYNENAKNRTMKYMKESRDKLTLNLPKGKKEEYKEYAQSKGMSLTELIMSLIDADMQKKTKE